MPLLAFQRPRAQVPIAALEATMEELALRKVRAYEKATGKLIRDGLRVQAADLAKIRRDFVRFRAAALARIPEAYAMNQAAVIGVLNKMAVEIDNLAAQVLGTIASGSAATDATAKAISDLFGDRFLPLGAQAPFIGMTPEALRVATGFSAELIGLRSGGLGARMLSAVNREIRLAALGAGGGSFNGAAAINRALGKGATWSWQAERIYRTEVLRIQSLVTEQSVQAYNELGIKTRKRWKWSGADRVEHKQIDGQTVGNKRRFTVPLRRGTSVQMRFPRDPSAPPSATINCGCYVIPIPAEGSRDDGRRGRPRRPARPKPKPKAAKPKPPPRPLTEREIQTARISKASERLKAHGYDLDDTGKVIRSLARDRSTDLARTMVADHLELFAGHADRMAKQFPGILKGLKGHRIRFTASAGKPGGFMARGRIDVSLRWSPPRPTVYNHTSTARWTKDGKLVRDPDGFNIETAFHPTLVEDGTFAEQVFRHETGHVFDLRAGVRLDPEWRALIEKYPTRGTEKIAGQAYPGSRSSWWSQNGIGEYSSKRYPPDVGYDLPDAHLGGGTEAWAELFATVTNPQYRAGMLPADIEAFVERKLGGSLTK